MVSSESHLKASASLPVALFALVAPDAGMERQARSGAAGPALLLAFCCALFSGFAQASRVDARAATLEKLETAGTLKDLSEKQIDDETRGAERLLQVLRVGGGLVEAPLALGLYALSLVVLVWFCGGRLSGSAVLPVAAAALLPGALANLLDGASALRQAALPPGAQLAPRTLAAAAAALGHPLAGAALKFASGFDFFSLWAAVLLGYGVAAAGGLPARRALLATLAGWVCVQLVIHVALGG